jgi:pilus assembly protein CpaB
MLMNVKAWIPLLIAIVLGLVAAIFAKKLTNPAPVTVANLGDSVEVATVVEPIAPGTEIRPEHVELRPMNAKDVSEESYFLDTTKVVGRVAVLPMVKGQPVLKDFLAPEGTAGGIQALVPERMRAISLEVNEFSGLSGMLMPGSFVDVISTIHAQGEDTMAKTIVQNVQVKAVGQRINPNEKAEGDAPMSRAVTLLVTPEQAEKLELAVVTMRNAGAGLPFLVLRSPTDKDETGTRGVTVADLRGGAGRAGRDPFETRPVEGESAPTSQPVKFIDNPTRRDPFATEQREVTIIRGGVESKVMLESRKSSAVMTGADTGEFGK